MERVISDVGGKIMRRHETGAGPLGDIRVVDLSTGIAGGYATKLFADAGAQVVNVEPGSGDPLRRWSASGQDLGGRDGVLFRFLAAAKHSVVAEPGDPAVLGLIADADLVVENSPPGSGVGPQLLGRFPRLVVLSLSPFGHGGPRSDDPATEFTIQAASGSIAARGWPQGSPVAAGGRLGEWAAGTWGAPAALAAIFRARSTGVGAHVDVSMLECVTILTNIYMDLSFSLLGRPQPPLPARMADLPGIEPTADGWVGFAVVSAQNFDDFCQLIERPDLAGNEELRTLPGRLANRDKWNEIVHGWTRRYTTAEIIERAAAFRLPVAPVCNGKTVLEHEQFVARDFFAEDPTGEYRFPRSAYLLNGQRVGGDPAVPTSGSDGSLPGWRDRRAEWVSPGVSDAELPLKGVKVLELTCWFAGPAAGHFLASLGADVIRIESVQHLDVRTYVPPPLAKRDRWWEYGPSYLPVNTNKRALTLDLSRREGVRLAERLIGWADLVVENFSPRVMENFGLGWDSVHALNPRAVMVRIPAFGLDGPWRDHLGFAQIAEQISGLSWVTGLDEEPLSPRGPADHIVALHAAFAALVGLAEATETGAGVLVEVPLVESALNVAAEQVLEYTAYQAIPGRHGNRSVDAAPQGIYACRGTEEWLAISICTDEQWAAFKEVLGSPEWAEDPLLESLAGRKAQHDRIDEEIMRWAADRDVHETAEALNARGVPGAALADPRTIYQEPQMAARGFLETCSHPVAGDHPMFGLPLRMTGIPNWVRSPAPTLGQHNGEILCGLLGLTAEEFDQLVADRIIGDRPVGA